MLQPRTHLKSRDRISSLVHMLLLSSFTGKFIYAIFVHRRKLRRPIWSQRFGWIGRLRVEMELSPHNDIIVVRIVDICALALSHLNRIDHHNREW